MIHAATALKWELRRMLQFRLLLTMGILLTMLFIVELEVLARHSQWPSIPRDELIFTPAAHLVLYMISSLLSILMIGHATGMSVRHYPLPVTPQALATVRLIPSALCCSGLYLVSGLIANTLFHAGWPLFSPALSLGIGYMFAYAMIYQFRGNETRVAVAGLFSASVLTVWAGSHYGQRWWIKAEYLWSDLTAAELCVLAAVGYGSWRMLSSAIQRDRAGAGWGVVIERAAPEVEGKPRRTRKFLSASTALFWQEWKQDGLLVPAVVIGIHLIVAAIHLAALVSTDESRHEPNTFPLAATFLGFLPLCAAIPWFVGIAGHHGRRALYQQVWPTGQSTLPLSDAALGWIYFCRLMASSLAAALGSLIVCLLWTLASIAILRSYGYSGYPFGNDIQLQELTGIWIAQYVLGLTLTLWLTSAVSASATLTGRRWITSLPIASVATFFTALIVHAILGGNPLFVDAMYLFVAYLVLSSLVVSMLIAYSLALSWNLIGFWSVTFGILLLIVTEWGGLYLFNSVVTDRQILTQPVDGLWILVFALAAAPPAWIPLSTYMNRHR